jgi:hypothetical protein
MRRCRSSLARAGQFFWARAARHTAARAGPTDCGSFGSARIAGSAPRPSRSPRAAASPATLEQTPLGSTGRESAPERSPRMIRGWCIPRGSARAPLNCSIADPHGEQTPADRRGKAPLRRDRSACTEASPTPPKFFFFSSRGWSRTPRGPVPYPSDPEIRADPKLPSSVGPARAAVARGEWGQPERLWRMRVGRHERLYGAKPAAFTYRKP